MAFDIAKGVKQIQKEQQKKKTTAFETATKNIPTIKTTKENIKTQPAKTVSPAVQKIVNDTKKPLPLPGQNTKAATFTPLPVFTQNKTNSAIDTSKYGFTVTDNGTIKKGVQPSTTPTNIQNNLQQTPEKLTEGKKAELKKERNEIRDQIGALRFVPDSGVDYLKSKVPSAAHLWDDRIKYGEKQNAYLQYSRELKQQQDAEHIANIITKAKKDPQYNVLSIPKAEGHKKDLYAFINNINNYQNAVRAINSLNIDNSAKESEAGAWTKYIYMTDDEKGIYNYLYAKEGEKSADSFLDAIANTLNQRVGKAVVEDYQNKDSVYKATTAAGIALRSGVDQFGTGIKQLVKDDAVETSPIQYAGQEVRDNLSGVGALAYDFLQTTANMAPSILISVATNGLLSGLSAGGAIASAVGSATMGASAAGNAYKEMRENGYDVGEARVYGLMIGASEATLEHLLGGIKALGGKKGLGSVLAKNLGAVDNAYKRIAIDIGKQALSEASEEALQEIIEPILASVVLSDTYSPAEIENIMYSALLGALSGGVFESAGSVSNAMASQATGNQIIKDGKTNDVIASGMETTESRELAEQLRVRQEKGKKITPYQLGELKRQTDFANAEKEKATQPIRKLGKNGQRGFSDTYKGDTAVTVAPKDATAGYRAVYNATIENRAMTETEAQAAAKIPDTMVRAAEAAARADMQAEENAVQNSGKAGLVRDKYYRKSNISSHTARVLDAISRVAGTQVRFVEQVNNGKDNARYANGVIEIALNSKNPVRVAFTHELVHRIKDVNLEAYAALQSYVYKNMNDVLLSKIEEGKTKTYTEENSSGIREEVVADAFGYILGDSARLEQFVTIHRNAAQKIYDALHDLIIKIKHALNISKDTEYEDYGKLVYSELAEDLDAMAQVLGNALESTAQAVQSGTESNATVGEKLSKKGVDKNGRGIYESGFDSSVPMDKRIEIFKERIATVFNLGAVSLNTDVKKIIVNGDKFTQKKNTNGDEKANQNEYNAKINSLYDLADILENSHFIKKGVEPSFNNPSVLPKNKAHKNVKYWYKFENDIIFDGTLYTVTFNIRDKGKEQYAYLIDFKENMQGTQHQPYNPKGSPTSALNSLHKNKISQSNGSVKKQSYGSSSSKADTDMYKSLIEKYGAIEPGEKPARDVQVPKKTSDDKNVRKFARTAMESGSLPDEFASEMEQEIVNGTFSYIPMGDKKTLQRVNESIEYDGWEKSLKKWEAVVNGTERADKNKIVLGEMLLVNAANSGDIELATRLAAELAAEATRAGQEIQAIRLLKKMSPEGRLYHAQQHINKLQEDLNERYGIGKHKIKVPEELYNNLINAKTQEEVQAAEEELFTNIAEQVPSTLYDKWNAWRYFSMLANPRTHVRNFVGNLVFMPVRGLKNMAKILLENVLFTKKADYKTASAKAYFRTAENKSLRDFIKKDREQNGVVGKSSKYSPEDIISEKQKVFRSKMFAWLEWARRKNFEWLEKEDMFFKKIVYDNSFLQYIHANKYTQEFLESGTKEAKAAMEKGRQYAIEEALKATYQDANKVAEFLNKITRMKKDDNIAVKAGKAVVEGVLPFKKTPMNIVRRAVEYSPLGLIDGVIQAIANVSTGKYTPQQAIDRIASGLTGTGLLVMGAWLASMGLLKGKLKDDDKEDKYKKFLGEQGYSLVIGDHSYTLDWAAPSVLPLFVGVEMYEQTKKTADEDLSFVSNLVGALKSVTEPMMELSMLQGLNDALDSVTYSDNKLPDLVGTALISYATQGIPTLFGQVARTIDDTRRSTYASKSSKMTKGMEYAMRKAGAKIPGVSMLLEPYVDEWGNEVKNDNLFERSLENFVSPGYHSKREADKVEKEIERLYKSTSEASVLPKRAENTVSYKEENYYKSPTEAAKFQKTYGKTSYEMREKVYKTAAYKNLSEEQKVDVTEQITSYANDVAKAEFFKKRGVAYTVEKFTEKVTELKNEDIPESTTFLAWTLQKDIEGIKDKNGDTVNKSASLKKRVAIDAANPSLSLEKRKLLYAAFKVGSDVIKMSDSSVKTRLAAMERMYAKYNK